MWVQLPSRTARNPLWFIVTALNNFMIRAYSVKLVVINQSLWLRQFWCLLSGYSAFDREAEVEISLLMILIVSLLCFVYLRCVNPIVARIIHTILLAACSRYLWLTWKGLTEESTGKRYTSSLNNKTGHLLLHSLWASKILFQVLNTIFTSLTTMKSVTQIIDTPYTEDPKSALASKQSEDCHSKCFFFFCFSDVTSFFLCFKRWLNIFVI